MQKVRVDDYLRMIDQLCGQSATELARSGQIAKGLEIATGTASATLKQLAEDGLIFRSHYEGARLTELGRDRLRGVRRRLRLIELWLSTSLQLDSQYLTDEALRLEPVASDTLIDALDSALGHPNLDSGGQSIPQAYGTLLSAGAKPSAETCQPENHST